MINLLTLAPRRFPIGSALIQCSRCHRCRRHTDRPTRDHPCPRCRNPEFGLVTVGRGRRLVDGWPDVAREGGVAS